MAAREYHLEIDAVDATLVSIEKVLDLPKLRKQADELEVEAGVPNLWDDPEAAQKITSRLSRVQSVIAKLSGLRQRVEDFRSDEGIRTSCESTGGISKNSKTDSRTMTYNKKRWKERMNY